MNLINYEVIFKCDLLVELKIVKEVSFSCMIHSSIQDQDIMLDCVKNHKKVFISEIPNDMFQNGIPLKINISTVKKIT